MLFINNSSQLWLVIHPAPLHVERDLLALPVLSNFISRCLPSLSKAHCIPGGSDSCPGFKPNSWSWSNYHQEEYQEVKPSQESSTSQWPTSPLAKTFSWPRNRERLLLMALRSPTWRTWFLPTYKGEFRDAICLRYGWRPGSISQTCNSGVQFSVVDHAIISHMSGFPTIRHNKIRDITALFLTEVPWSHGPPTLMMVLGWTDIHARDFWNEDEFFDVRVFYPNASSNRSTVTSSVYRDMNKQKNESMSSRWGKWIMECLLPWSSPPLEGFGWEATTFYKRFADMISLKRQHPYSTVMG